MSGKQLCGTLRVVLGLMAMLAAIACQTAAPPEPSPVPSPPTEAQKVEQFELQARTWRENGARVELPEEARKQKVLAENAIEEKDLERAIGHYEAALNIYPTWPEGQFNAAFVNGEAKRYRNAILHMKYYLALAPNAADAQKARDRIIIWEDRFARDEQAREEAAREETAREQQAAAAQKGTGCASTAATAALMLSTLVFGLVRITRRPGRRP